MTDVEPQDGEPRRVPLPRVLKRRLFSVAFVYVGLLGLLMSMVWAEGLNTVPWLIVAVLPLLLGVFIVRNASIVVRGPAGGPPPPASEVDAAFEATTSPFTPRIVGLFAVLALVMGGTSFIVNQSAPSDSPELSDARAACNASWDGFAQGATMSTRQSWTECLLRNPSLVSECGMSATFASAMFGVDSIAGVSIDSADLMACGDSLY